MIECEPMPFEPDDLPDELDRLVEAVRPFVAFHRSVFGEHVSAPTWEQWVELSEAFEEFEP